MATAVQFEIKWENNNFFQLKVKEDQGGWVTLMEIKENAAIKEMSTPIRLLCMNIFAKHLDEALKEMNRS